MTTIRIILLVGSVCSFLLPAAVRAQDESRPVWQVANFDIVVDSLGTDRALNAHATLAIRNIGRGPGSNLTLRINSKAEIRIVTINATNGPGMR